MRTRVLVLMATAFLGTTTFANAGTKLTPLLGLSFYSPSISPLASDESVSAGTGFNIGGLVSFDISPETAIELGLINNGNSTTLKDSTSEGSINSRSWELPAQFRFMVSPSVSLAAGGYFESFSNGTVESGGRSVDFEWKKPSTVGLKLGGRFHAPIQPGTDFIADLSYKLGLSDRTVTGSTLSYKDRSFTLSVGATFDIGGGSSSSAYSAPTPAAAPSTKKRSY